MSLKTGVIRSRVGAGSAVLQPVTGVRSTSRHLLPDD